MRDIVQSIVDFNAGRARKLLALKFHAMQDNPSAFFRGTCQLFYEDWSRSPHANDAPAVWICGDLHLENFGCYRDGTGAVCFDINDFDDAILAPFTWDLVRMLTSLLVASHAYKVADDRADSLCDSLLDAYAQTVQAGQIGIMDVDQAPAAAVKLITTVQTRQPRKLLDQWTRKAGNKLELKIDDDRTIKAAQPDIDRVIKLVNAWREKQPQPTFDKIISVAHREAGTGSLGLENYVLLVQGKNLPDQYALLNLKAAITSALAPFVTTKQPAWNSQAQRIISAQQRVQASSPLIVPIGDNGLSYVMHDLQPSDDRIHVDKLFGKARQIKGLVTLAGQIIAWDQLRSTGHEGAATTKALIDFVSNAQWRKPLIDYAKTYVKQVLEDFAKFRTVDADALAKRRSS